MSIKKHYEVNKPLQQTNYPWEQSSKDSQKSRPLWSYARALNLLFCLKIMGFAYSNSRLLYQYFFPNIFSQEKRKTRRLYYIALYRKCFPKFGNFEWIKSLETTLWIILYGLLYILNNNQPFRLGCLICLARFFCKFIWKAVH